ncbi:MAG TPA: hypothetical protein VNF50_01905 [Acidimicrobiales bacterium]|nr:hypothetical protein [Acidimicrobiales bacterium]
MTRSSKEVPNQGPDLGALSPGEAPRLELRLASCTGGVTLCPATESVVTLAAVESEGAPTTVSARSQPPVVEADQDRPALTPSAATLLADIVRAYLESHDGPGKAADSVSRESQPPARMGR